MGIKPIVFALVTLLLTRGVARAKNLQEIVSQSKPSVVKLVVLDADGEVASSGSGFVISRDGRVATNFHVVEGARSMKALFDGGKEVEVLGARGFDAAADLAIVQLGAGDYAALSIAEKPPSQGDSVVVIGSPTGLSGTVSTGIVSAVRADGLEDDGDFDAKRLASWNLQISAPISPGSSGSPVLDADGRVLGVAVGRRVGQALNFAVPAKQLSRLVESTRDASTLIPLEDVRTGRSTATNLAISGAFLLGIVLIWTLSSWVVRRRERKRDRDRIANIVH